jgi:hypothetical protein
VRFCVRNYPRTSELVVVSFLVAADIPGVPNKRDS